MDPSVSPSSSLSLSLPPALSLSPPLSIPPALPLSPPLSIISLGDKSIISMISLGDKQFKRHTAVMTGVGQVSGPVYYSVGVSPASLDISDLESFDKSGVGQA